MTTMERAARPARTDSVFFPTIAIAMALTVFAGFSRTFFLRSVFAPPPLANPGLMIVHGVVFTSWIALLITQTSLVAAGRRDVHRTLGWIGMGLVTLMVFLGTWLAVDALRRGDAPPGAPSPEMFFAIPMFSIAMFPVLVAMGVANRARPDWHKRFMIMSTVAILTAAVARIPFAFIRAGGPPVFFGLTDLFVLALVAYDLATKRRVHPATLWSAAIVLAGQIGSVAVGMSAPWQHFAAWLVH